MLCVSGYWHLLWKVKDNNTSFKAQTTIEYAIFIILIAVALIASQVYIKRAIQGRWKEAADSIGQQYDYHSTFVDSNLVVESNTISNTIIINKGMKSAWLKRVETSNTVEVKNIDETIAGEAIN